MPRPASPPASRPVAWALLSQAIWLPLVVVDLQDRWSSRRQGLTPHPIPGAAALAPGPSGAAGGSSLTLPRGPSASALVHPGLLLGSSSQGRPNTLASITDRLGGQAPSAFGVVSPGGTRTPGPSLTLVPRTASGPLALLQASGSAASLTLQQAGFSRAELLGGPITLADLHEGQVPPMALAELGRRALSGDPLATLPAPWREPMRQALANLPSPTGASARLERARHIHVPSSRVSHPTEVPLALQADGSVDILSRPDNDAIVEEIRDWSARQAPPAEGSVTPALVHLHPVPESQVLRPSPADLAAPAAAVAPPPAMVSRDTAPSDSSSSRPGPEPNTEASDALAGPEPGATTVR
jgi:hypothetical protein